MRIPQLSTANEEKNKSKSLNMATERAITEQRSVLLEITCKTKCDLRYTRETGRSQSV